MAPLLISQLANAQTISQKFSMGLKAAPTTTVARYRDRDLQKQFRPQFVFGYSVGGQIKFPLKERYSFLAEFGFSQKGRSTRFDEDGRNRGLYYFVDGSMALRRSFDVRIVKNIPTHLYLNVGPNVGYWLSGKGTLRYNPGGSAKYIIVFNEERTSDFSKYYYYEVNRWLFGLDLGVGVDAPLLRKQKIYAEFRVTLGQTQLGRKKSSSVIELVPMPADNLLANLKTFSMLFTYTLDLDTRSARKGKSTLDKKGNRKK